MDLGTSRIVSGHFHATALLPPGEEHLVSIR